MEKHIIPPYAEKPHFVGESIQVWIVQPAGAVTFMSKKMKLSSDDAKLMAGPVMDRLHEINTQKIPLSFYHDWRLSEGLTRASREKIVSIVRTLGRENVEKIRVEIGEVSSTRKIVAEAIMMTLRILGHDVQVINDMKEEIQTDGLAVLPTILQS